VTGRGRPAAKTAGRPMPSGYRMDEWMVRHSIKRRVMCIIHTMQSRELIKLLQADGWQLQRTRGSHHQFVHPTKAGTVTVPHPKKDLGKGLVRAIRKQAGLR
jgi:predicted RNA binding protein YcfA (HicA-like mRNA interferase family)